MTIKAKYPVPTRNNVGVRKTDYQEFYPEFDIGSLSMVLPDGRPIIVENWFDRELRLFCRTVWYSAFDIESWGESEHYRYVEENGLLRGKTYPMRGAGIKRQFDDSGQDVWAVTVVIAKQVA